MRLFGCSCSTKSIAAIWRAKVSFDSCFRIWSMRALLNHSSFHLQSMCFLEYRKMVYSVLFCSLLQCCKYWLFSLGVKPLASKRVAWIGEDGSSAFAVELDLFQFSRSSISHMQWVCNSTDSDLTRDSNEMQHLLSDATMETASQNGSNQQLGYQSFRMCIEWNNPSLILLQCWSLLRDFLLF